MAICTDKYVFVCVWLIYDWLDCHFCWFRLCFPALRLFTLFSLLFAVRFLLFPFSIVNILSFRIAVSAFLGGGVWERLYGFHC